MNIALWLFGALSVFAGALVVSIIIFTLANSDMDLHREIYGCACPRITFIIVGVWMLLTGVFVILCDLAVRKTSRGYTYPLWIIVMCNVLLSVLFGIVLYRIGVSYNVDYFLGMYMRNYYNVDKRRMMLFNMPDKGIIMGRVIISEPAYVVMLTPERKRLAVITQNIDAQKLSHLRENEQVVFLGKTIDDDIFIACDVRVRPLYGAHQTVQENMHKEMERQKMEDQKLLMIEYMRKISAQALHVCDEKVRWRIVEE